MPSSEVTQYQADVEAIVPADTGLYDREVDGWIVSVAEVARLARYICDSPFVRDGFRGSAPSTAAAILYGREIGVPPMTALQTLHVIKGKVGMDAELMRARVLAAGHDIEFMERTAAICRMRGRRRGSDTWTEVAFSISDARQAGLLSRGSDSAWTTYPRAMLTARATTELCSLVFPDVTHGMTSVEVLADMEEQTPVPEPAVPPRLVQRRGRKAAEPEVVAEPPSTPEPATSQVGGPTADEDANVEVQGQLEGDGPLTQPQTRHIMALLRKAKVGTDRDARLVVASGLLSRPLETFKDITVSEASRIINTLVLATESEDPKGYVTWLVDQGLAHIAMEAEAEAEGVMLDDATVIAYPEYEEQEP